ncbi:hypothetical protein RND81_04G104000 [Saponaria officinalis]|uniref:Uncharacterized protein n=1 Tax=Saponaria officinalis TaxID=3572 RepID=A0AAW1LDI9_SAPOF
MSRCFPFPPPGYEKKLRVVDDVTLLAKEKGKEIKEKRDKKDKNKEKDGREKDRKKSKDKDRHKEKDKEKHTHRDKEKKNGKKRSRDEKRFEGDRPNVEKVGSNSPQSSCVQELEQRINFVDGAMRNQFVQTIFEGNAEFLDAVASRRNGAYQKENGQRDNCTSKFPKVVFSNGAEQRTVQIGQPLENDVNKSTEGKDMQKHHIRKVDKSEVKNAKRHKGEAEIVPKEIAIVRELEQRIKDENGAIGSQNVEKANVTIENRTQNLRMKEFSELGNESHGVVKNGQKGIINSKVPKVSIVHNTQSKVPKVAIVHNLKTKERVNEVAGVMDVGKKSPLEVMRRNGYCEKGAVDNKKIIQLKDEVQNKPRKPENVKEESDNVAEPFRIGQNVSDSADNSKRYTFKMIDKTAGVITGKRKETESNGILHGNETRPMKLQRTVQPSQPSFQNGRNLKTSTTITLSASKPVPASGLRLDSEGRKSNSTVLSQPPPVSKESPTTSRQSSLGSTKPFISLEANGAGMKFPSSAGKVDRKTGSTKLPLTEEKVNGTITGHGSPPNTTNATPHVEKIRETVGCSESAKPPVTTEKVNGIVAAHGSPLVSKKPPSTTSGKEKRSKHKSSSKPLPPHPDTKYLSQILSVPKLEELPELDDSDWLLESKTVSSKEHGEGYGDDGDEQVWAKAVHIESADIHALPYVIPY